MSRQTTVARIEEITARVCEAEGLEMVEVELKGTGRNQLLRIFIDKPDGVSHGDCERISHAVGDALEASEIIAENYTLEVSSPGVERKLKRESEFQRFSGRKARLVIRVPEGKNKLVEGTLAGTDGAEVLVDVAPGEQLRIPFASIERANLKFEW